MAVVAVGINERDVSLDVFEQGAIAERDLPKALQALCDSEHISEAVVLSTCLRTEVYAVVERFHDGLADIEGFFRSCSSCHGDRFRRSRTTSPAGSTTPPSRTCSRWRPGSTRPVLGEGEILRQVRTAAELAQREHAAGPVLGTLFRHAVEAGKRVRTETAIAQGHDLARARGRRARGRPARRRSRGPVGARHRRRRDGSRLLQGARAAGGPGPRRGREPLAERAAASAAAGGRPRR